MKRYHIYHLNAEDFDLAGMGMPESIFNVRACWDRKLGGHGLKAIQIQLTNEHGEPDGDWINVLDGHEDHDPDAKVFCALRDHIDTTTGLMPTVDQPTLFEDDALPEFAGGRPSQTRALERLSEKLHSELSYIRDKIADMLYRMREQEFDGDFDPTEKNRAKAAELQSQCDALTEARRALPDDRTDYEKAIDERDYESACVEAEMRAEERHTRWYEGGCFEKQYSDEYTQHGDYD